MVGRRADVDLDALLEVMGSGSANSTMLQLKGKPMLEHDFTPLFKLEHMLKDVAPVPRRGARRRRAVPVRGAGAASSTAPGVGRGLGEQDFAAVLEVVEGLAGHARLIALETRVEPFPGIGPIRTNVLICRDILRFRDFVHSM